MVNIMFIISSFSSSAEYLDKMNLRFRRAANETAQTFENVDEDEYEHEFEDSDKPRSKRAASSDARDLQNDVKDLNYDLK